MGFQPINVAIFQHIEFFTFDIQILIFKKIGWCVNVYTTYVIILRMWTFRIDVPSRCARSMNLMYVWLLIKHQHNYVLKYVCDLYEIGT